MNYFQSLLRKIEVGEAQVVTLLLPFVMVVILIMGLYNFGPFQIGNWGIGGVFRGLPDAQSMDNAQLARQIARGQGFTTEFIRPYALEQVREYTLVEGPRTGRPARLFDQMPAGVPRILPDTYNSPAYPYLLGYWFKVVHLDFNLSPSDASSGKPFLTDRLIPPLNLIFLLLTAALVFLLGYRLFDQRVAWISLVAFVSTDMVWRFAESALSTSLLMFLITGVLFCAVEIFAIGEESTTDPDRSLAPTWIWAVVLSLLLAAACLTRLQLLILLAPLLGLFILMPRAPRLLFPMIALVVMAAVLPWFWRTYEVCGNALGSNVPLLLNGAGGYEGDQIYRASSIPNYDALLKAVVQKEFQGFLWHLEHFWDLFGYSPLIVLFAISFLHFFRQARVRALQWVLLVFSLVLIAMNNLAVPNPEALGGWNIVVILFPPMLVIGTAYFFLLLTRLDIQIGLLRNLIICIAMFIVALPMIASIFDSNGQPFCFPPYLPPAIRSVGQFAKPDEWTVSDMPWAAAWYADRSSLWLPDTVVEFERINDTLCPTGILFLSPYSWHEPLSKLMTGENKEWYPMSTGILPNAFPLHSGIKTGPSDADFLLLSDRPRWTDKPK